MSLSLELIKARDQIREHARAAGLDFFEVIFEVLDWNQMNSVAAYGGFPNRYPHWRFGMEYEQISKSYAYGLSKIYEMVINNDPSYAYLLHSNAIVDQKMVMAHVYGHSDFFKNNVYFSGTNRKMIDEMGNHRSKVMTLMADHGLDTVEGFIDVCLSIENLIDRRRVGVRPEKPASDQNNPGEGTEAAIHRFPSKDYMERFVNPPEYLQSQRDKAKQKKEEAHKFPERPERDVLNFLWEYAPLEQWEKDILWIVQEEAYYFAPQAMTKIMNEGWASYHHSQIMTGKVLNDAEIIDYADHHSGTVSAQPGRLNPYKLGMELFRSIEERWNKGRFGPEYDRCDDLKEKIAWDKKTGQGRQKIFEVRKLYNDLTFLDAFLDEEFCHQHKLFMYGYNPQTRAYEIVDRDFKKVKAKLLEKLVNVGQPRIEVADGNAYNRGELMLHHLHDGTDLKRDWAWEVLQNLQRIWKRPVHLKTKVEEEERLFSYDGAERKEQTP